MAVLVFPEVRPVDEGNHLGSSSGIVNSEGLGRTGAHLFQVSAASSTVTCAAKRRAVANPPPTTTARGFMGALTEGWLQHV